MHKFVKDLLNGEKVEWKKLGEVCEIKKGQQLNKKLLTEKGTYPAYNGGINPSGYTEQYNVSKNKTIISQGGASAGYVQFINEDFWANAHCYYLLPNEEIVLNKYVFYFCQSKQLDLMDAKYGAGIPALKQIVIAELNIPLPPLKVQQKIVDILDQFCQLKTALKTEKILRLKQYAFYRDKLLGFGEGVEWQPLKEIFHLKNGYTPSKRIEAYWTDGTIPWFRMEDIRENGRVLNNSLQKVNQLGVKGKLFEANSFIISTSATIGEHALITIPFLSNQRFTCMTLKEEYKNKFDIQFLFHYCFLLGEWCKKNVSIGSFANVNMDDFRQCKLPIPPLEEQKRIADILDKFHKLTNDLTEGLPREIELREKQYCYYRDQLLNFEE